MKTSVKLLLAFATAAAAIAPAAAQQVVAWDEAYRQADARIAQLTLDEKISFMRGYSSFFFYGVPEKGMPYIYLSDATQGVHMRDNLSDPTMVRQLERSTAFPCPISLAATFNPSLAYRYAEAVGEECRAGGIEVLLGPGMNIYRNSQNGRNFEYMGEDPLLASAMVAEYVKGMQSTGTVACLKHFICNDTEFYRRRSNSIVDERALHELYLPPFKAGIDAGVGYVMTSYNRLNGEWAGQNADLIRRILRGELGFRGCVMSDWSSVNDTEKVVKSGQNVEMPGRKEFFGEVRALLKEGRITEKDIEKMIRPNIATSIAFGLYDREKYVPALLEKFPAHKQTGYDVAAEGIVLLRNNGILPLAEGRKILLTGRFQNHGAACLSNQLQESPVGVVSALPEAQEIEFQGQAVVLGFPDEQPHPFIIDRPVSGEIENIRVGHIGVQSGIHGGNALADIGLQNCLVCRGLTAVDPIRLVTHEVLAQNHVFHLLLPEKVHEPVEVFGVVFRLHADMDFQPVCIAVPQSVHCGYIAGKLLRVHPEGGIVISGEEIGRVIGKAQYFQACGQCRIHIFLLAALGMVAARGMGVIVCNHKIASFSVLITLYHVFYKMQWSLERQTNERLSCIYNGKRRRQPDLEGDPLPGRGLHSPAGFSESQDAAGGMRILLRRLWGGENLCIGQPCFGAIPSAYGSSGNAGHSQCAGGAD